MAYSADWIIVFTVSEPVFLVSCTIWGSCSPAAVEFILLVTLMQVSYNIGNCQFQLILLLWDATKESWVYQFLRGRINAMSLQPQLLKYTTWFTLPKHFYPNSSLLVLWIDLHLYLYYVLYIFGLKVHPIRPNVTMR